GMLMQAQPVYDAYLSVAAETDEAQGENVVARYPKHPAYPAGKKIRTIYMTPQGRTFTQEMARELAQEEELVFLCGHYEGIDERVLEEIVTDYVSLGDYVLTGGELPAMVMIDVIARLVPGVLHNGESAETESFHNHLLEYPQYSRPEVWRGKSVPEVLLSGNHKKIEAWRLEQSLERTRLRRPDLYARYQAQQDIIGDLAKQKRKYIHLMELLARGMARIVCCQGKNVLVNVENTQIYVLHAESPVAVEQLLGQLAPDWLRGQGRMNLAVCQESVKKLLVDQYGLKAKKTCYQACYTRKESLRVGHRDIRLLGTAELDYVAERCKMYEKTYLRRRILAKAMYGIYVGQEKETLLAGCIGVHEDGSMGMLYVDETYRCQGLAASLESWLINWHLKRGDIPFCQIEERNIPGIRLQEKLGLYLCSEPMWWLEKDESE
ncbi:MAG: tRNA (guanosine(37)-N1)-methyltransferase TrmD, partial [Acetatifactor sp.]|nr:tRNA (guanosine(37)-N1)-methyltransferase TrmD [Acetatifactor sp.]